MTLSTISHHSIAAGEQPGISPEIQREILRIVAGVEYGSVEIVIHGKQVVIDNRAGAGGNIGADLAAKAMPDGYTLLMPSGSVLTVNPHIYRKLSFDAAQDFLPITNVASGCQWSAGGGGERCAG